MVDKSDLTENLGSNNIKNELNSDINDNAIEELLILRQTIEEKNEIIENLKKENEDLKNLSIRLKADFENYKKRVREENKDLIRFSNQRLLQDLLPIIDDFDRAIASIPADKIEDPIFKGLTIILTNFHNLLEQKYNLKKINELNVPFDPLLHEAISLVEDPSANGMMVAEVFLPGYKIDERVLRAAKVLVKISKDKIALDREVVITRDKTYQKYEENHIYVIGDWSNFNSRKVAGKVITAIKDGFADWKPGIEDQVCLHLEEAVVDHTTAATLAQIIFNDLKAYSNIKIYCHEPNYKILESADGFSMIRKLVFIQKA